MVSRWVALAVRTPANPGGGALCAGGAQASRPAPLSPPWSFDVLGAEGKGQRVSCALRGVRGGRAGSVRAGRGRPGRPADAHPATGRTGPGATSSLRAPTARVLRVLGSSGLPRLLLVAGLFSGLVCFWLSRTLTRPIDQLRLTGQAAGARRPERTCTGGNGPAAR